MTTSTPSILSRPIFNGWPLFWLISLSMCAFMVFEMSRVDLAGPAGVSHMIGYSVRFAVPLIFIVIATSSLRVLMPNRFTTWLLRNRKQVGLCFAVAMGWQGLFIFLMSNFHSGYYYSEVFFFRDELEGSTGYLFLSAMVVTSFGFGRRWLNTQQWKLLHTAGVFYLWAYPFSTYWWGVSYYDNPALHDHVFYWLGFAAVAVRVLAWGKKRQQRASGQGVALNTPVVMRMGGFLVGVVALVVAATGRQWQDAVTSFLTGPAWSANLELWLPFWPLEPFLSLFLLWGAVALWTGGKPATAPIPATDGAASA